MIFSSQSSCHHVTADILLSISLKYCISCPKEASRRVCKDLTSKIFNPRLYGNTNGGYCFALSFSHSGCFGHYFRPLGCSGCHILPLSQLLLALDVKIKNMFDT